MSPIWCSSVIEVDKGTDVAYLDLCKVFNMVPHHILTCKVEKLSFYDVHIELDHRTLWLYVHVEASDEW